MSNQDKLQAAIFAFEQWRKARTHGAARIPEALRQQAVKLLPHFRVSQIIRALKLSHSQLKRWDHAGLKKVPAQTQFIKLPEEKNVSSEVNAGLKTASLTLHGMIKVIEQDILPRLECEIPEQPTAQELMDDKLLHRFTLVFDREGYSPAFLNKDEGKTGSLYHL